MDRWMEGWTDGWTGGYTVDRWMDRNRCIVYQWMGGWTDVDRQMDGFSGSVQKWLRDSVPSTKRLIDCSVDISMLC